MYETVFPLKIIEFFVSESWIHVKFTLVLKILLLEFLTLVSGVYILIFNLRPTKDKTRLLFALILHLALQFYCMVDMFLLILILFSLPTMWEWSTAMSPTNRRELNKLEKLLATNEQQFRIVSNQIDAQWSVYQDHVRANAKYTS